MGRKTVFGQKSDFNHWNLKNIISKKNGLRLASLETHNQKLSAVRLIFWEKQSHPTKYRSDLILKVFAVQRFFWKSIRGAKYSRS